MKKWSFLFILLFLLIGIIIFTVSKQRQDEVALIVGGRAPHIQFVALNNKVVNLSDLKGSYVLLDFWGSWCLPCRKEHPALTKLYKELEEKSSSGKSSFHFVSIALERDSSVWLNAIEKDKLSWPLHVMEKTDLLEEVTTPLAKTYNVAQLPARFLINDRGIIIGIDQTVEDLKAVLSKKMH